MVESATNRLKVKQLQKKTQDIAHEIERVVTKIPPSALMTFGVAACTTSSLLLLTNQKKYARLFGMWASTALALGLYLKLKKQ